jgi:hypothetical protein
LEVFEGEKQEKKAVKRAVAPLYLFSRERKWREISVLWRRPAVRERRGLTTVYSRSIAESWAGIA